MARSQTFFAWLSAQQPARTDLVGELARSAVRDRLFPRQARKLSLFLLHYRDAPEFALAVKIAHREWRTLRRRAKAHIQSTPKETA